MVAEYNAVAQSSMTKMHQWRGLHSVHIVNCVAFKRIRLIRGQALRGGLHFSSAYNSSVRMRWGNVDSSV